MKENKTLYPFSKRRYEFLNLYQKNVEAKKKKKKIYLCVVVFLPLLSPLFVLILILKT